MSLKNTDRKKKERSITNIHEEVEAFKLPDSLPCSQVVFPVLIQKRPRVLWSDILEECENSKKEIDEYVLKKSEPVMKSLFINTESDYIRTQIFKQLLPALEETLDKAKMWESLHIQKCFFNGIDHLVQLLWNNNPRYPLRKKQNLHVFNMPWVRKLLLHNPRPYYPKSWLWPEDYAATYIQKSVRQYFVQKDEEVQEMRDFWRKLKIEKENPDINMNPFLSKMLASLKKTQ